ncbi:MAG: hypothetical protein AB1Z19_01480 [Eubacteriales bacterium]
MKAKDQRPYAYIASSQRANRIAPVYLLWTGKSKKGSRDKMLCH